VLVGGAGAASSFFFDAFIPYNGKENHKSNNDKINHILKKQTIIDG